LNNDNNITKKIIFKLRIREAIMIKKLFNFRTCNVLLIVLIVMTTVHSFASRPGTKIYFANACSHPVNVFLNNEMILNNLPVCSSGNFSGDSHCWQGPNVQPSNNSNIDTKNAYLSGDTGSNFNFSIRNPNTNRQISAFGLSFDDTGDATSGYNNDMYIVNNNLHNYFDFFEAGGESDGSSNNHYDFVWDSGNGTPTTNITIHCDDVSTVSQQNAFYDSYDNQ
jgi:hypothetical protein